jgi:hypothetical protein
MVALASICFLAGAVLGLRFKVLILVPAIGLSVVVVAMANGIVLGESAWRLALVVVVAATSIQLGYVLGTVAQLFFAWAGSALGSKPHDQQPVPDAARRVVAPTL